jgi:aromatic ring-opening dioxygenase catalytic subunit (LigB family)
MTDRLPTRFISHGGGPWPLPPVLRRKLARLEQAVEAMPAGIGAEPRAVRMVSGNRETHGFAVTHGGRPPPVCDQTGFPPATCRISYPAPAPSRRTTTNCVFAGAIRVYPAASCV